MDAPININSFAVGRPTRGIDMSNSDAFYAPTIVKLDTRKLYSLFSVRGVYSQP